MTNTATVTHSLHENNTEVIDLTVTFGTGVPRRLLDVHAHGTRPAKKIHLQLHVVAHDNAVYGELQRFAVGTTEYPLSPIAARTIAGVMLGVDRPMDDVLGVILPITEALGGWNVDEVTHWVTPGGVSGTALLSKGTEPHTRQVELT